MGCCLLGKLSDYIGNHGFFSFHNTDYAHLIIPHTSKTETILRWKQEIVKEQQHTMKSLSKHIADIY